MVAHPLLLALAALITASDLALKCPFTPADQQRYEDLTNAYLKVIISIAKDTKVRVFL